MTAVDLVAQPWRDSGRSTTDRVQHVSFDRSGATLRLTLHVTNVAERSGTEVVQVYVGAPPAADAPPWQLKAFKKIRVDAGGTVPVEFAIEVRELASYSETSAQWILHPGLYEIAVGASSGDLRLCTTVDLSNAAALMGS